MKKDFKNTLNIFNGTFEMKANLNIKEPEIQKQWELLDIYNKKLAIAKSANKKSFVLHDGPPYSNGNIHLGHALNKIIKDFIVRWHSSKGEYTPMIFGWDNHGLPIENAIEKKGIDRKTTDPVKFREICRDYAKEQIFNQLSQFKKIGLFTDFSIRYATLREDYVLNELKLYHKMVEKELVYRSAKPIFWSWSSESALAENEVIYQDVKSVTSYATAKIVNSSKKFDNDYVVIWTTLPWTIAANQAIAINAKHTYIRILNKENNKHYILSKKLFLNDKLDELFGWKDFEIIEEFMGSELDGLSYESIWDKTKPNCKIAHADFVTDAAGTGLVGCAGGFGEDDFKLIIKMGLEPFICVDKQGKFNDLIKDPRLEGAFIDKATKIVNEELSKTGELLGTQMRTHSFPHDWRTKKPIMFLATAQWSINIDKCKKEIDDVIVNNVSANVDWNKERLRNFIKERDGWTISRQRLWGVPIIAFYDENDQPVLNSEVVKTAIDVIEKNGVDCWYSLAADEFLPEEYKGKGYRKETDILDVWFDSGSSNIYIENTFNIPRPFDLFLEGGDQYRGWFNSSIINSVIYDGKSPYRNLASHGMVVDEEGRKMSKSSNNSIEPSEIISQYGSDILRLWVASTDYSEDVRIGDQILKHTIEGYRKIRNTIRFLLNNLSDFDPEVDYQKKLSNVDNFALYQLYKTKEKVTKYYDLNKFNTSYKIIVNYISNKLSAFYLDFTKDILYVYKKDDIRRRQVQTVMYEQLWLLFDLLRPILPHTIEEAYSSLNIKDKAESIHLLENREQSFSCSDVIINYYKTVLLLRDEINEKLEIAKAEHLVKKGFEAVVKLKIKAEYQFLRDIKDLATILIVNKVIIDDEYLEDSTDRISSVEIIPATGEKCERCWMIVDSLTEDGICEHCQEAVS